MRLSTYGRASTRPAPVSRMMAEFSHDFRDGIDLNLGIGYVNEDTIPVARLREAMDAVAADGFRYRQAYNYGSPAGSANLIAALRRFLLRRGTTGLTEEVLSGNRLAIGACGATSILDSISEVLPQGIVVTSDPMYYIYAEALERRGFEILAVPEDQDGPDLEALDRKLEALGDRAAEISFFYFVTVNNPSCTLLSNPRRLALLDVAQQVSRDQDRKIPVFFDLAYEWLSHDPAVEPFASVLGDDRMGIAFEIGTLSKILAPALRIGYILGPGCDLMNALVQKTSDIGFSAPVFVQEMAGYLLEHGIEDQLRQVNEGYRQKALIVRAGLEQHLGSHLEEVRGGRAGFYFYLTFKEIETHPASPFFRFLTRTTGNPAVDGPAGAVLPRVLYIPGEYCVHSRGDLAEMGRRQLRLSYGFEQAPRIVEALAVMRRAVEYARPVVCGG